MKSHKKVIDTENIEELKNLLAQKDRELEIEAALERVRTMTMAMHKTEGLIEVIKTVFKQFGLLEVRADVCFINIHQADSNDWNLWVSTGAGQTYQFPVFPYIENPVFRLQLQARERGDTFYTSLVDKKSKDQFFDHFFKHLIGLDVPKARSEYIYNAKGIASSFTLSRHATIALANYSCISYTEEENLILQRIGNVFEQTYTRFLDLQKAEAQAREAQIEAALERVRAASMAMHKSEELQDVVAVVFEKLMELGFELEKGAAIILIFIKGSKDHLEWIADPTQAYARCIRFPYFKNPLLADILNGWKNGTDYYSREYSFQVKNDFFTYAFEHTDYKHIPDARKETLLKAEKYSYSIAFEKNSAIGVPDAEGKIFSKEKKGTLKRFAKVFEQTYTRFLDLQKAEAQAREAQIEVALERVRARTMGMHRSDELLDTAQILFQQLQELGIGLHACGFSILDQDSPVGKQYLSVDSNLFPEPIPIRFDVDPYLMKAYEYWKKGKTQLICDIQGEELKNHLARNVEQFKNLGSADILANMAAKFSKGEAQQPQRLVVYHAFFRHGILFLTNDSPIDNIETLVRFAKVFEQSYTRFLDLQKAEAQARESEIQLALERVRARTMAMHTSAELADAASVLFQQILALDLKPVACAFVIVDEKSRIGEVFISADGTVIPDSFMVPYHGESAQNQIFRAWKKKEPYTIIDLNGEKLEAHLKFIARNMPVGEMLEASGEKQPDRLSLHIINFRYGFLGINFLKPNEEAIRLLQRFAKVFEQTYTRFLDLQKAEEQARESQIEAALEKVRAASMAMHKSEELTETAQILFEEVTKLDIDHFSSGICVMDAEQKTGKLYFSINGLLFPFSVPISYQKDKHLKRVYQHWKKGDAFFIDDLKGQALMEHNMAMAEFFQKIDLSSISDLNDLKELFQAVSEQQKSLKREIIHLIYFDKGAMFFITETEAISQITVLKRFAKVFEQTYTRFLDLQRAEAQARESEIQLALERVRARTMAMHRSDELVETSSQMFQQLELLGIKLWTFGFNVWVSDQPLTDAWSSSASADIMWKMQVPHDVDPVLIEIYEHRNQNISIYYKEIKGKQLQKHIEYMFGLIGETSDEIAKIEVQIPSEFHFYAAYFKDGYLLFVLDHKITEASGLFPRFAMVFEQTYTRFLDLQKAEAQARESQIEVALEKVRSASMAMHKSDELIQVVRILDKEVLGLGIETSGTQILTDFSNPEKGVNDWYSREGTDFLEKFHIPNKIKFSILEKTFKAVQNGTEFYTEIYSKAEKNKFLKFLIKHTDFGKVPKERVDLVINSPGWSRATVLSKNSILIFQRFDLNEFSKEEEEIFKRFGKVFEQAYVRFLDLKKAENQAREAQIEAALERIRSASMAMHKSEELPQVALTFLIQIEELAIPVLGVALSEINTETNTCVTYFADNTAEGQNRELSISKEFEINEFWMSKESIKQMKSGKKEFTITAEGERLELWIQWIDKIFSKKRAERLRSANLEKVYFHSFQFHEHSSILFSSLTPLPEEYRPVIQRLVATFRLSYLRFLDLQKAEAQSREAQIEVSMERIRSRSLAMRTSDEIKDVMVEIRRQIDSLGQLDLEASVVHLYEKGNPMFESIAAVRPPGESGDIVLANVFFPVDGMDRIKDMMDYYWSDTREYTLEFDKEMAEEWQQVMLTYAPTIAERRVGFVENRRISDHSEYWNFADFSEGSLLLVTHSPASDDTKTVLRKAAQVFDFAYRRFRDLQKAEARALEAIKQASLDRVRGVISSMRSAVDLNVITPLIFKELMTLGVPFIRCGVFIIQEKLEIVEAYLSSPDGNSLGVLRLPYQASELTYQSVEAWRKGVIYRQHWNKEDFVQWLNQLMAQDQIQDSNTYQGAAAPPESLDLHFVPFAQGMLYVGNVNPLDEKELELVQSLAKAFSIAFARYEDFVKLEKAKAEVESAMSELKSTQAQLIQQEKLASLGQLTSGIAHEIKNPLNFVNNFSEVSMEMIEEILDSRLKTQDTRPKTEADEIEDEILEDIKANLEKIHQHGTRANGIVTSMLQHSRGGSGKKEPTDLNTLIKEYVNFSFHGMRAGKNPINVDIILELDPEIKEVSLIKEDFTRVVINLCNNAFDAVREKVKLYQVPSTKYQEGVHSEVKYLPKLQVTTLLENGRVRIAFEDNGPGIPEEIKDKILQPFFTTKKGTEGTGLGLSITHDIIKAHGGELIIETTIGLGTAFIFQLSK